MAINMVNEVTDRSLPRPRAVAVQFPVNRSEMSCRKTKVNIQGEGAVGCAKGGHCSGYEPERVWIEAIL